MIDCMIPRLLLNTEKLNTNEHTEDLTSHDVFNNMYSDFNEIFSFETHTVNTNCFIKLFKGFEESSKPRIVDYGHALTPQSIDKYISAKYGISNPKRYLVEIGTMSFDYETPWKCGSYIDKDSNNTHKEYDEDEIEEEMKNSYLTNRFLTFYVFDITRFMFEEDYVELPTAQLAKQAGFDWECRKVYWRYYDNQWELEDNSKEHKRILECDYCILAPTQAVLQRWLREEKGIICEVHYHKKTDNYQPRYCRKGGNRTYYLAMSFTTYEVTLEAGLQKCLTLLFESKL